MVQLHDQQIKIRSGYEVSRKLAVQNSTPWLVKQKMANGTPTQTGYWVQGDGIAINQEYTEDKITTCSNGQYDLNVNTI